MKSYLNDDFGEVKAKNSSEKALQRWRKLCWLVKNLKRRFCFTANLSKRFEAEALRRSNRVSMRSVPESWKRSTILCLQRHIEELCVCGCCHLSVGTWQQWFISVFLGFLGMPIAAAIKMIPVGLT